MKLIELYVKNFRGVKEQTITDIGDALVLIGKNNAGKSAILTAIRALYDDYNIAEKDFYKESTEIEIKGVFLCDDYLENFFLDSKIGVMKIPSNATEYNEAKIGTIWEEKTFVEFKSSREEKQQEDSLGDIGTIEDFMPIWLKVLNKRFDITNGKFSISFVSKKTDCKKNYDKKDAIALLPKIAFIDDTRNFVEEENGKSQTITSNIFNVILNSEIFAKNGGPSCNNCTNRNCETSCIDIINSKSVSELTCEDLEKLVNYRTKLGSDEITNHISEQFAKNYRNDFKINIKATSNINKSFSISTKIYDPALESEVELSNVGAGVRSIYILSLLQVYQTLKNNNTIFVIEEPELYLHPQLQKSMAKTISDISKRNQVFFTTHSPLMLRDFQSDDIRNVKLNETDYHTEIETTKLDDILDEIGYSTQDIINTDFIIFVEGTTDKEVVELIIKKYYDIDIERITVIDTKSCNNIVFYASLRFLEKTKMGDNFVIIRDCDTKDKNVVESSLENKLKENIPEKYVDEHKDQIFITDYSSIEGYLFSPELLVEDGIFSSTNEVYEKLQVELSTQKEKQIKYFKEKNNDEHRLSIFESEYDVKRSDISSNIEWMKQNIRGHNYFSWTSSKKITLDSYVNRLPENAFSPILSFLDRNDYFKDNRK